MRHDEMRPGRPARTRLAIGIAALLGVTFARGTAWAQPEDDLQEGDRYYDQQDWKHAAAAYDTAIRKYPSQVQPAAYGKRAGIYIILNDFKGGLAFLHDVAEKQYPNAPEVLEQEALILWHENKKPEAIKIAEKVVKAKPTTFSNQALIGEFYFGREPARSVTAYEAYFQNRREDLEKNDVLPRIRLGFAYLALARTAIKDGNGKDAMADYGKAIGQFEILERKFGKSGIAKVNAENGLCGAYTGQGHFDQAITVCERIIQDPHRIDANGSVWFNLGLSYLANKQPKRARTAANEYVRLKKNARGYMLIGDSYFGERDWANALDNYLRAEKLLKPGEHNESVELSIHLGKTYRRLPYSGSGPNPNLAKAIEKLKAGLDANPTSIELGVELGGAYVANRQDDKALVTADPLIRGKSFAEAPEDQRAGLLVVSAKAYYNQHKLKEGRGRFEDALKLRPRDLTIRRGLVETINAEALTVVDKEPKTAEGLFRQALGVDGRAPMTSLNLAVFEIDRGDCDAGAQHLERIKGVQRYALAYHRLLARTYLCRKHPDPGRAAQQYAEAESEVRKVQANLIQAEIYTEWAPLIWDKDLAGAIDKLQTAVQFAAQVPDIAAAAKRNLAIALFRRGWLLLKDGKASDAVADFERANREPALLKGSEPLAFEFSYALALLDKGDTQTAAKMFKELGGKGNQSAYLKAPYNKIGAQFFSAYANYRSSNLRSRERAASEFQKLAGSASGSFGAKIRALTASAYEMIAIEALQSGQRRTADKALASAGRYADAETKRRIELDRLVAAGKDDVSSLASLGASPPEALVDLGIAYDKAGRPKDAYDAWLKARAKNVGGREMQRWIDAKKRIYGF
jgi:Tetratricopeptide repeat